LLSTKIGVQSCPTALKAAPEQYPLINYLIEVLELAWSSGVLEWNFRCHQPCSGFAIMRKYITQLKKMEFNEKVQVFSSIVFSLSHLKVINTVTDTVSFLATWPCCWNFSSRYMTSQRIRQKHVVLWFALALLVHTSFQLCLLCYLGRNERVLRAEGLYSRCVTKDCCYCTIFTSFLGNVIYNTHLFLQNLGINM
jgi:hypothetical protein